MMNTEIYSAKDIEILDNGISVDDTFFSRKQIAKAFNELIFMRNFIKKQSKKN